MKYLIILLFIFTSCARSNQDIIETYPEETREHVYSFLNDAKVNGLVLKLRTLKGIILTSSLESGYDGYYYDKYIYLDTTCYNYKYNLKFLMYHELGHALLGRGDDDTKEQSIMNGLPRDWKTNQEYYIKELFKR